MTIASKEANETAYWLSLLHDNGYLTDLQLSSLDNNMQRILCKLIAIVKTTKENLEKRK
jgi:four helix bundle protein